MPSPIVSSSSNSAVGTARRPRTSRLMPAFSVAPVEGLSTSLLTGLECYWKLDEASGAARVDSHGVEDLADNGGMTQAAGKFTNAAVGAAGKCLTRASNPNVQLGNQNLTFSVWVYPTSTNSNTVIFSKGSVADIPSIEMSMTFDSEQKGAFEIWQSSGVQRVSGAVLNQNAWNHIVARQDVANNSISVRVNGGTVYTATRTKTPVAGGTALSVGAYADNLYHFLGRICEFGIWKRVLTDDECTALYNAGAGLAYPFLGGAALYTTVDTTDGQGQNIRVLVPGNHAANAAYPIVLYHHGSGENQASLTGDALKQGVVRNLLGNGYLVASSNQHGENWGAAPSEVDARNLYNYLSANYLAAWRTVHFSQSAGGFPGLLTVCGDFTTIPYTKGWVGIYPACDLANMYAGGYQSAIQTAFNIPGGGTYAAQTAGFDPVLLAASKFDGLRMRFYASSADAVVGKVANTDAMRTLVTGHATELGLVTCTGNHGDPSHFRPVDVAAFAARCA